MTKTAENVKKVGIVGHFGGNSSSYGGQTAKTRTVATELERRFGKERVNRIDTYGGIRAYLRVFFRLPSVLKSCDHFVMLPAHNGVKLLTPAILFWNAFYKKELHYVVIGGWLPNFLKKQKVLAKQLKKFHGIYVETNAMKRALEEQRFANLFVVPNCKELTPISVEEIVYQTQAPYRLCTFSRVMKQKGIEDAVSAVKRANERYDAEVFALDIYGLIDDGDKEWFENAQKNFPGYVQYRGKVPFSESVDVLKTYFALLFPTYYEGEGFAGTLIDAMSAGVPVIASDWKYNPEIVSEDIGFLFPTRDVDAFTEILCCIYEDNSLINDKKETCLVKSRQYLPKNAMQVLIDNMQ